MTPYRPSRSLARANWKPLLGDPVAELKARLPELKEAGNWFLVTAGFWVGDFLLHDLLPTIRYERTAPAYFGNKLIWTIPALLVGRLFSDYVVKGSTFVRALTIGTVANAVTAVRYLKNYPLDYVLVAGLVHEALLVPLSLLIVGPSPATGLVRRDEA